MTVERLIGCCHDRCLGQLGLGSQRWDPDVFQTRWMGSACTMAAMPNIASILKAEISRVARKQIRSETSTLKTFGPPFRDCGAEAPGSNARAGLAASGEPDAVRQNSERVAGRLLDSCQGLASHKSVGAVGAGVGLWLAHLGGRLPVGVAGALGLLWQPSRPSDRWASRPHRSSVAGATLAGAGRLLVGRSPQPLRRSM